MRCGRRVGLWSGARIRTKTKSVRRPRSVAHQGAASRRGFARAVPPRRSGADFGAKLGREDEHDERPRHDRRPWMGALGRRVGRGPEGRGDDEHASVFSSSAIVQAPRCVESVSAMAKCPGCFSRATLSVPLPFDENAVPRLASKATASTPSPIISASTTAPVVEFMTTRLRLWQPENSRWCARSNASPVGSSPGASGQRWSILSVRALNETIALVLSGSRTPRRLRRGRRTRACRRAGASPRTRRSRRRTRTRCRSPPLNEITRFVTGS